MKLSTLTPIATVLAASLTQPVHAETNPFVSTAAPTMVLAAHHEEGKCGEGKCGTGMKEAIEKTNKDAKNGTVKADQEGKCGEGKCGAKRQAHEGKCGGSKVETPKVKTQHEGKCGEGKCGAQK
ncbi:hypothetical protein [Agitococcus lubricus]|uniref:Low-complexity protein n=1 Tax=Agitococcus lubricus TaxID=1077255 RepID=A0A2T5IX41_9GAMM|nr:hypothetical protein [Agitococcus lubricus]PTQ88507.1 hypothetical protein C8N29_11128 [Agitococcus lubricus]